MGAAFQQATEDVVRLARLLSSPERRGSPGLVLQLLDLTAVRARCVGAGLVSESGHCAPLQIPKWGNRQRST